MKRIVNEDEFIEASHTLEGFVFNLQAKIAEDLLRHLAIATAVEDGEDSAGRQKFRLMTPEEVSTRAFAIAEKTVAIAIARGHIRK